MSKTLEATVIATKMQKTIVVRIDRTFRHDRYGKVMTKQKKYKVHCEDPAIKPGDFVLIQESRPISKDKHFTLVKKLKSAPVTVQAKVVPADEIEQEAQPKKTTSKKVEAKPTTQKKAVKVTKRGPKKTKEFETSSE